MKTKIFKMFDAICINSHETIQMSHDIDDEVEKCPAGCPQCERADLVRQLTEANEKLAKYHEVVITNRWVESALREKLDAARAECDAARAELLNHQRHFVRYGRYAEVMADLTALRITFDNLCSKRLDTQAQLVALQARIAEADRNNELLLRDRAHWMERARSRSSLSDTSVRKLQDMCDGVLTAANKAINMLHEYEDSIVPEFVDRRVAAAISYLDEVIHEDRVREDRVCQKERLENDLAAANKYNRGLLDELTTARSALLRDTNDLDAARAEVERLRAEWNAHAEVCVDYQTVLERETTALREALETVYTMLQPYGPVKDAFDVIRATLGGRDDE